MFLNTALCCSKKRGSYDEDDFTSWIGTDGEALYWVAEPEVNKHISDNEEGVLLKTVLH